MPVATLGSLVSASDGSADGQVVGAADGLPGSTVGELDGLNKIAKYNTAQRSTATCLMGRPMTALVAGVWGEQWESSSTARDWVTW